MTYYSENGQLRNDYSHSSKSTNPKIESTHQNDHYDLAVKCIHEYSREKLYDKLHVIHNEGFTIDNTNKNRHSKIEACIGFLTTMLMQVIHLKYLK